MADNKFSAGGLRLILLVIAVILFVLAGFSIVSGWFGLACFAGAFLVS